MALGTFDFAMGIGGEAGQGIATPGDIFARIVVRRGLHLSTYNAYQSIIRGGHIFLTLRICDEEIFTHGDKLDLLLCLNQDTMDRHQRLIGPGGRVLFNSDTITPGESNGADLCAIPVGELTQSRNRLIQNTVAMGARNVPGAGWTSRFWKKASSCVSRGRASRWWTRTWRWPGPGFEYAQANFPALRRLAAPGRQAVWRCGPATKPSPWAARQPA